MQKESLEFGSGSFVGVALNDPEFHELPIREQARIVGWADGCPVVDELTDPNNPDPGRGPEAMLSRYGQVNFWFGHIARTAKELNPGLYSQLTTPVERLNNEPVGKHEPQSVPASFANEMSPMGTLAGYSLPRLFVKQIGNALPVEETQARLFSGLDVLERTVPIARTPEQLLVLVASDLSREDVPPVEVLRCVLSAGWLGEHNAMHMLDNVKLALRENAPELWQLYSELSPEEKTKHKIA